MHSSGEVDSARAALINALIKTGVMKPGDPRLANMTAEEAARFLSNAGIDPSTIDDPAVRAALNLSHRIANGDLHAMKELAAHASGDHHQAKSALHDALIACGLMKPGDPRLKNMTPEQMAKMLHEAGIDPATIQDPHVRAALRLASRFAKGDVSALKELANEVDGHESHAKNALTNALLKLGILKPGDPRLATMTAEEAARMLSAAGIDPATIDDPAVKAAVRLASRIAAGDKDAIHELANKVSGKTSMAQSALTNALVKLGILKPGDPRLANMTPEEAAAMLVAAGVDPSTISDPAVAAAVRLAKRIADGDHSAIKELAHQYAAATGKKIEHLIPQRAHMSHKLKDFRNHLLKKGLHAGTHNAENAAAQAAAAAAAAAAAVQAAQAGQHPAAGAQPAAGCSCGVPQACSTGVATPIPQTPVGLPAVRGAVGCVTQPVAPQPVACGSPC